MNYFIVGGAGFVGSHLVITLLNEDKNNRVIVYDNFSSGKRWHLQEHDNDTRLRIIEDDVKNDKNLNQAMAGCDIVYHFASNPDISKAVTQPDIDFWEGTYLTNNVLEAMRINGIKKLFYASGSGIYGDTALTEVKEDHSPMLPISTYGASKLACEALICSYCHMFDMSATAFRFANVVGPHQTHGVGYDFVRRLMKDPSQLNILGDGKQSKSYIYITDIITALKTLEKVSCSGFSFFNVSTKDNITVTEIADLTVQIMGLKDVKYVYTGTDRGWKGDVPVVRLNSDKIRSLGWSNVYSTKQAIELSIRSIYNDSKENKFQWDKKTAK